MTVIAWDGKTLAADKRATYSGCARTVTKIRRAPNGELVAFSGDFDTGAALADWYCNGADPATFPDNKNGESNVKSYLLVIRLNGSFAQYERTPIPLEFEDTTTAQGSGRDYALAAMHLGRTAAEAVQVACALDIYCGNGIDTLELIHDPR